MFAAKEHSSEVMKRPGAKSHFQFKNWVWDEAGVRQAPVSIRPISRECADLVNTCYYNRATGTRTLYALVWDLDAHRAESRWKTATGQLKWNKIKRFLFAQYPQLSQYFFAAIRSTSGKGIALALAISPMELVPEMQSAQNAARALQGKIFQLLNHAGLGADSGALGLERDFPNWHDNERLLYCNKLLIPTIQSTYGRRSVVTELLGYLKQFPFLSYQKKRDKDGLFYPDIRAEVKLAKLYEHAMDNWSWSSGASSISADLSTKEIAEITGLSRPFLFKFLKFPPTWLKAEWLGKNCGWRLLVKLDLKLSHRAVELSQGHITPSRSLKPFNFDLKRPEDVQDGERNEWLKTALLILKHNGTEEEKAGELIKGHLKLIPNYQSSRNCKQIDQIIRSIYSSKPHLFGIKLGCAPSWLLDPAKTKAPVVSLMRGTAEEKKTTFKKGALPPVPVGNSFGLLPSFQTVKVSLDQFFRFRAVFYSVPSNFIGRRIVICPVGDFLRVVDPDTGLCICVHKIVELKGSRMVLSQHRSVREEELFLREKWCKAYCDRFSKVGKFSVKAVSALLLDYRHMEDFSKNLRRVWLMFGYLRNFGREKFEFACRFGFMDSGRFDYDLFMKCLALSSQSWE